MTASQRHAIALLATTLLAVVIAYLTLTPPRSVPSGGLLSDKVYHVIAFAALVFPGALLYVRSLIWLVPAALVFGAAIELIQPLVGRSADTADFVADVVGVACGLASGYALRVWRTKSLGCQKTISQLGRSSR